MNKIIIIDDEPLARTIVKEYLKSHIGLDVVAECDNGYQGMKAIMQHQPDLIFLDIQMPKINGFEMLELIDQPPPVIFTTAFDEFAIKAFEANSIDYLLKPFDKKRFDKAIEKWNKQKEQGNEDRGVVGLMESPQKQKEEGRRVVVKNGAEIEIIPVQDIAYFEAYDDYVKIYTAKGYHLKKKTMTYYEETLDPSKFLRTHRSYLINLEQLTRIEPLEKNTYIAILKDGKKIPVSRSGYLKLKEKLSI